MSGMGVTKPTNNNYAEYKREYAELNERFEDVKDKQGAIGSLWDSVKGITGVGVSEEKCSSMLEKFKNGEVNFEQAADYIEKYDVKQKDTTDLIANILTGVSAIATTTIAGVMGGPILPVIALGAGVGAATKTVIKLFDRATNKVENDEFDAKTIAKDIISGALTGATSAVPSGVAKGIKAGSKAMAVKNGVKCGLACGAASGSISYLSDVTLDDKEFKFGDLAKSASVSAFISGTVGAGVGAGLYDIAGVKGIIGKELSRTTAQTIASDSTASTARKILIKAEKSVLAPA